ncbi:MAG: cobalamin-binding protein [Pseudomonadales bacterium]|nr:cobalamin-binding protein [Pseudomonadales bacterium]
MKDDSGRSLRFAQPPQRIISLSPHITELLFAAGADDRIVAVSRYSDYPEAAKKIPIIGDAHSVNIEMLVALNTDLVLVWQSGNSIRTIEMLERLDIPYFFSDPKTVPEMIDSIRTLGLLVGDPQQANRKANQLQQRWEALQNRYSARSKVRVFYQIWHEPLFTISNPHIIDHLIQICGGENIFSDQPQSAFRTQLEAVIVAKPEVIFFGGLNRREEQATNRRYWQRFTELPAVTNEHLIAVPDEWLHRPAPRLLDGADYLCEQLDRVRKQINPER